MRWRLVLTLTLFGFSPAGGAWLAGGAVVVLVHAAESPTVASCQMLDRLKRADRAAKGVPFHRKGNRHVQARLGKANLLEGGEDRSALQYLLQRGPAIARQDFAGHTIEAQLHLFAGGVERRECLWVHAGRTQADKGKHNPVALVARHNDGHIGNAAIG